MIAAPERAAREVGTGDNKRIGRRVSWACVDSVAVVRQVGNDSDEHKKTAAPARERRLR